MENKIPTAEEFIEKNYYSLPSELEEISWLMQEFAKLHVEAALKEASKKSYMLRDLGENEKGNFTIEKLKSYNDEEGYPIYIDKNSILNAYPLTNIK